MKKSGLADSPFFKSSSEAGQTDTTALPPAPNSPVPIYDNSDNSELLNFRTSEQMNESSQVQEFISSNPVMEERAVVRRTYNVYLDQAIDMERIGSVMSQKRRGFISKGKVIQMALDIGIEKLKKRYPIDVLKTQK
jgi:hypothetical protein